MKKHLYLGMVGTQKSKAKLCLFKSLSSESTFKGRTERKVAGHYILFTVKIAIEDRILLCDVNIANLSSICKD